MDEDGELIRQEVEFEWKLIKCTHCSMFGDTVDRRKEKHRMEWIREEVVIVGQPQD